MTETETELIRRCPTDGRPLERTDRWLCSRCLHTYPDHPSLLGPARRPTVPDPVGGRAVNLKLGEERLARVDAYAIAAGISRAKAVRRLLDEAMGPNAVVHFGNEAGYHDTRNLPSHESE